MGGSSELGKTGILVTFKEKKEATCSLVMCLLRSFVKRVQFSVEGF